MEHPNNCECQWCNMSLAEQREHVYEVAREEFNRAENNYMRSHEASIARQREEDTRCYVELNYRQIMAQGYSEEQARKRAEDDYVFSF